ncbi:MAG: DUF3299 domain-containing protein [Burkholderiales bacterium]|nr:DUF3299 domain-containing protein [Phycisphaerae bacterium]
MLFFASEMLLMVLNRSPKLLLTALILAAALPAPRPAMAEDTDALLARADLAFANAEYHTAIALYSKLEQQLTDPDKLESMLERKRVAKKSLASAKDSPSTQPATAPARKLHVPPPSGGTLEITLPELGNFDFTEDGDTPLPEDVQKLSGSRIKVSGQMLALDQAGKVSRFLLVNDMMSCCFGVTPKLQNIIYVTLPEGKMMETTTDRITLEGTLTVAVRKDEGFILSLFEMSPTSVKIATE